MTSMMPVKRAAGPAMTVLVLLLPLLCRADGGLDAESAPSPYLTPPQLAGPLARVPRNDSVASASSSEPEARALSWPDCNPCDREPWVPMARALHMPPPPPQYALSIPAIQLTLPVNYGIPVSPLKQYGAPQQTHPSPPHPSSQGFHNYGPPPTGPAVDDAKGNPHPQNQYSNSHDDQQGLPPPPLPQIFLSPTYGPPQPQTQFVSSTNVNPTTASFAAPPPPPPKHQLLPSVKFGPVFNQHLLKPSPLASQPLQTNPVNQPLPPNGARPLSQQYRDDNGKKPTFISNPIPFPTMSKTQLPPLFNYQTFNDGKQTHLHTYLQPPKPQNVVFTITETEDNCRKCQQQSQLKDSETAQAEQVTESVTKTDSNPKNKLEEHQFTKPKEQNYKPLDQEKSSVQIVKSVPLAEYLSSIEYPMQIVQAPILDVPDLSKYFNLGYNNFPQVQHFQGNSFRYNQKPPHDYNQKITQSSHHLNHGSSSSASNFEKASTTPSLDNIQILDDHTANSLPPNHKLNYAFGNPSTTESTFSQSTPYNTISTTRPSQIFHITKSKPTSHTESSKKTTIPLLSSSTLGHYVTSQPITTNELTSTTTPAPLLEPVHSSTQNHQSTAATANGLSPSGPSSLRHHDIGGLRDWTYARGWGNTPPQPFVSPTAPPHRVRFSVRPTPAPPKKAKHIHQIIVPYTTNKQTSPVMPANALGWTAIPPLNQGRKVPPSFNFGDHLPSSTGSDQLNQYQNEFPTASSHSESNIAFTSTGSDNLEQRPIFPTSQGQPLNLPPQVINHILHLNQKGTLWPTGPEGLQQLLVTNLQGLLRGEEDSIDIARLQKNIDNWTAEGYKQSAPSVNFIPVTASPHILHSKKIPDEYLTSTEPNLSNYSQIRFPQHNFDSDHEGSESQKLQIKVHPLSHAKDYERPEDTSESIESLLNSWSLLDTKVTLPTTSEATSTAEDTSSEPTSKAWEKIQVSISPLTNEKVYVVTPVPATKSEENSTFQPTSDERSHPSTVGREGSESSDTDHSLQTAVCKY